MQEPITTTLASPGGSPPDLLAAAFRDLHGQRLHGFALLVTLGDRATAGRLAADALHAGQPLATTLRHPERAAAWLRARIVRHLRGTRLRPGGLDRERLAVLGGLGVDEIAARGLASLRLTHRAALVASVIERLDPIDVETVLGSSPGAARRAVDAGLRGYLAAAGESPDPAPGGGPLARRVREAAARAIGPSAGDAA